MAAAGIGLEVLLDFLDDSGTADEVEVGGVHTPRIDQVLQKYRDLPPVNQGSCDGHTPQINDHPDERLLAIEKQLAELLEKNGRNQTIPANINSTKSNGGARDLFPCDSDSSTSPPRTHRQERQRRAGGRTGGKENKMENNIRGVDQSKSVRSRLADSSNVKESKKMLRNLERERERRWKAEQAAVKLAENVRKLQIQVEHNQQKQELLITQSAKLESSLVKERAEHAKVKEDRIKLKSNQSEMAKEFEELHRKCEDQSSLLKDLETQLGRLERERVQYSQRLRDAEITAATNEREAVLKEQTTIRLQQQIHDLQELLATREQERMKELNRLKPASVDDVKNTIEKEVVKERVRMEGVVSQHKERLEQQVKSYRDLEEEFRTALRIEATRYHQLERDYDKYMKEYSSCKESLEVLKEKEGKSAGLVSELTIIVKEQKGRIVELSSARQELLRELREKAKALQSESKARTKIEERASATQEENNRLVTKLNAHESIITGLREERKLWSQELALQGASLAQDRGKMEGQIDSLNREVKELRDRLEHCTSSLRIKDKVIQDETQTIKVLKEQLSSHKDELSALQSDWSNRANSIQDKYEQEKVTCRELQEQLDLLTEDKMALENELREIEEKEGSWKEKYRSLKVQWEERVNLIASLEGSVHQLQEKAKQRQIVIEEERDQALEEIKKCKDRMAELTQTYKEQLISQEAITVKRVEGAVKERDMEITELKGKVVEMEGEMKSLLEDSARERKIMEEKFQRMSKTFHELQKELT